MDTKKVKEIPKELVFDEKAYETYFGGDKIKNSVAIYTKCAERVMANMDSRLARLKEAIERNDSEIISSLAHQLKGGIRTLGGVHLGEICLDLEMNATKMSLDELRSKFSELQNELIPFKDQLSAFVSSLKKSNTPFIFF